MLNKYADQVVSARAKMNMSVQKLKEIFTPDLESSQQVLATKYADAKFNAKVVVLLGASAISGLMLLSVALIGASEVALAAQSVTNMLYSLASSLIVPVISGASVYVAKARIEYKLAEKREAKNAKELTAEVSLDAAPEITPEVEDVAINVNPNNDNSQSVSEPKAEATEESEIKKNFSDTGFEMVSENDESAAMPELMQRPSSPRAIMT